MDINEGIAIAKEFYKRGELNYPLIAFTNSDKKPIIIEIRHSSRKEKEAVLRSAKELMLKDGCVQYYVFMPSKLVFEGKEKHGITVNLFRSNHDDESAIIPIEIHNKVIEFKKPQKATIQSTIYNFFS